MAKAKKEPKKLRIALDSSQLSRDACITLSSLTCLLSYGYDVMTIDSALESFKLLKKECGGDAKIRLSEDDHMGNSADITWYRDETDVEFEKRLKRNKAIAEGQRKKRATDKKKSIVKEKAELKRLQKKYPKE